MKIRVEVSSLATPYQSGVSSYTRLLSEALAADQKLEVHGHYFNCMKRQPLPGLEGSIVSEENVAIPLRVYAKLQSYNIAPPFDLFKPKVDLTIFPNFATWPTVATKLRATTVHDLTYMYYPEVVEEKNLAHLRRVVPRSIKQADFILTVSESVKQELVKEFNLDPEKCVVTAPPPEAMFFEKHTTKDLETVRQKYDLGSKKFVFFIGNFEPRKNLSSLIAAYRSLPPSVREQYQLVLAGGKGWKSEETQKVLDDAISAGESIKHIGYVDAEDRPKLYQAASLFVMPSLYEGFGIPVLEAMVSGCPVLAADVPVLREAGGEAALYVETKDTAGFAKILEKALHDYPYSIKQMQQNVARFSWEKNVEAIIVKTNELLQNR